MSGDQSHTAQSAIQLWIARNVISLANFVMLAGLIWAASLNWERVNDDVAELKLLTAEQDAIIADRSKYIPKIELLETKVARLESMADTQKDDIDAINVSTVRFDEQLKQIVAVLQDNKEHGEENSQNILRALEYLRDLDTKLNQLTRSHNGADEYPRRLGPSTFGIRAEVEKNIPRRPVVVTLPQTRTEE